MGDEDKGKGGSLSSVDPLDLVKAALAAGLVGALRIALHLLGWTLEVPGFLKDVLNPEQLLNAIAGALWLLIGLAIFLFGKWRNRRRHVHGKADPGKVAIWVAELEGDGKKGEHRTNIVRTLEGELGSSAQILRAGIELRLEEAGDAALDSSHATRSAQEYLAEHGGDLLIWGQIVAGPPVVIELRFISAVHDGADGNRFSYDSRFLLEAAFGKQMGAALAAVAAQQALPALDSGLYVADVLVPVAKKLAGLAAGLPAAMSPAARGAVLHSYALVEATIGEQRGDSAALGRSVEAYRRALEAFRNEP